MKGRALLVLAAWMLGRAAYAADAQDCSDAILADVADWAHIRGELVPYSEPGGLIVAAACKAMPGQPDTVIAAIAFDTHHEGPEHENGSKEQVVALVDGRADKVIAAARSTVQEDALTQIDTHSYRIDTAPYRLSPTVRAFGVVFDSAARGPSCPDASADSELTLWVRDGRQLRAVFGSNLRGWVSTQGTACAAGTGDARSEDADMTIGVEKTTSHGFADLSITAHITENVRKNGQFADGRRRTARDVLKYDGKSYGIDMFRNFWYPDSVK